MNIFSFTLLGKLTFSLDTEEDELIQAITDLTNHHEVVPDPIVLYSEDEPEERGSHGVAKDRSKSKANKTKKASHDSRTEGRPIGGSGCGFG